MLESMFKSPVLQTGNPRLLAVFTNHLKAEKIAYTVKSEDLNDRGGFNNMTVPTPHTKYQGMKTVYVARKDEKKALLLLSQAKQEASSEGE